MLPEFRDLSLLRRALTHRSYLNEHPEAVGEQDNERLEFLGDAVLDFIAGAWLFDNYPHLDEGNLTTLRAALVKVATLAEFARTVGMQEHMRLGKGEVDTGGRNRSNILGDAFEALLGALYMDQGIDAARAFVLPFLEEATPRILQGNKHRDPKSRLQEWSQTALNFTPRYTIIDAVGPDHAKVFTVEVWIGDVAFARGSGPNRQAAEQSAALAALERADGETTKSEL